MNVYFDNAATTMPCPEAVWAVNEALSECWGNPSAAYLSGRRAAEKLRNARESVAAAIGCKAGEVYFTSGGTESDNWAIRAAARLGRHKGRRIITGAAEHDAVRKTCEALAAEGWDVVFLKPDKAGRVSTEAVSKALTDDTALISLMLVNNETGAVNPIAEISELIREKSPSALLHVDAVQGLLKVPFTPKKLGADLVSVSSHKIHGPKGAGALYIREGLRLVGLLTGGGQEGSIRPGTEAMPNIMGFGAAAEAGRLGFRENASRISGIKDLVIELLREKVPGFLINGEPARRGGDSRVPQLCLQERGEEPRFRGYGPSHKRNGRGDKAELFTVFDRGRGPVFRRKALRGRGLAENSQEVRKQ